MFACFIVNVYFFFETILIRYLLFFSNQMKPVLLLRPCSNILARRAEHLSDFIPSLARLFHSNNYVFIVNLHHLLSDSCIYTSLQMIPFITLQPVLTPLPITFVAPCFR